MTASLTPERLAEARHWVAQGGPIGGAVVHPLVRDLLAALDVATERAEKAEAALERVQGLVALEESTPGAVDGFLTSLREAMEGQP